MEYELYKVNGELSHWGIKGMRWGVRRYQNKDGSLTEAGKKRKKILEGEISGMTGPNTVLSKSGKAKLAAIKDELYKLDGTKVRDVDDDIAPDSRETRKLSALSKDKNAPITRRDRDSFVWDVEGTDEDHWNEKLSSKNPEHVKKVVKELDDFWDNAMNDIESKNHSESYYQTYVKDNKEAYAKAVLEEVEHWRDQREKAVHSAFTDELQHHGTKGMRWGIRRYQNKDGSLTEAGKKRYGDSDDSPESKEAYESRKQTALKSGSAKDILEFKGDLTQQEMQSAINRIRWEQEMSKMVPAEVDKGKARSDAFFNKVGDATNKAITLAKGYNVVASVINAFNGSDSVSLPKIDLDTINKTNKVQRGKEKEAKKKREEEAKKAQEEAAAAKKSAEKIARKENTRQTMWNRTVMDRAKVAAESKATPARLNADEYDFTPSVSKPAASRSATISSGKSFVDSYGDTLFTVSSSAASRGKAFVDAYGDTLFSWDDD